MQFSFSIPGEPPTNVIIERDGFTGRFKCTENGRVHDIASVLNPFTHFNLKLEKVYELAVGDNAQHQLTIKHIRPLLFAGFRPHRFQVWVDGKFLIDHTG